MYQITIQWRWLRTSIHQGRRCKGNLHTLFKLSKHVVRKRDAGFKVGQNKTVVTIDVKACIQTKRKDILTSVIGSSVETIDSSACSNTDRNERKLSMLKAGILLFPHIVAGCHNSDVPTTRTRLNRDVFDTDLHACGIVGSHKTLYSDLACF